MKLEVCSSPVTAVCDTSAKVSCLSQRLLKRFPVNFNQLQPVHRLLLLASQAEKPPSGIVTYPISLGTDRKQQKLFVLKSSKADCFRGLDFPEDNHCDSLFSSMQLRFPISWTVSLLCKRKASSDPSYEQVNVIEQETNFIPAGLQAVILGELRTQSFPEKSEDNLEPPFGKFLRGWIRRNSAKGLSHSKTCLTILPSKSRQVGR